MYVPFIDEGAHGERIWHADAARAVDAMQHGHDDEVRIRDCEGEGRGGVRYVLPCGLPGRVLVAL